MSLRADAIGSGGIVIGSTATTSFEHHQVPSNIVVEVDWDNDGDFDQPDENITGLVLDLETFTGRDWPSQLTGKAGAGRLTARLNNTDGRFSYFNQASPLNTDPFSLQLGRRIRVRTTEAGNPDPVLLARDRFRRPAGALIATENGLPWIAETADQFAIVNEEAVATNSATVEHIALIDLGVNDAYLQATHGNLDTESCGIYYRHQDTNNRGFLERNSLGELIHHSVIGGIATSTVFDNYWSAGNYSTGITFGILFQGTEATIYHEGVPVGTVVAAPFASTRTGISATWGSALSDRPSIRSFYAWDGLPEEIEGILWTGQVSELQPAVGRDQSKTADLRAEGPFAAANTVDVAPQPAINGTPTGLAVGHVLGKANLMHPPGRLHIGDVTTGPWGFDTRRALDLARLFEDTEAGFMYETQEGYINFDARAARDSSYSLATFSDKPGTQYSYESIEPRDWRNEIFNQVTAGVAPSSTDLPQVSHASDTNNTAGGVANDVNVTMPSGLDEGKLVLVVITSTVGFTGTVPWLQPIWWVEMRGGTPTGRQRVYAHICDGSESGTDVLFYDDTAASGGAWHADIYVIPKDQWYGAHEGIVMAEHNPGPNPPALTVPWGLEPTLFFATYCGMVSILGGSLPTWLPQGYGFGNSAFVNGSGSEVFDMFQSIFYKADITRVEDPGFYGTTGLDQFVTLESTVIAVRGFNGDPIPQSGVTTVTRNDTASQDAHDNTVRTLTGPNLFRHPAAAGTYCDRILGRYANDRPIFEIGFTATKSGAYRSQATKRRVGHRITLEADGRAGMGVSGDFHIESIRNRFRDGTTMWDVAWELSPAENVNRADTTASELAVALVAADQGTTETFTVTVTDGPIWITSNDFPHMFPFRAVCQSERWLVTEISGQTATQTWTVQRADNGFPQAHSAGTAVRLFDQWILP